MINIGVLGKNPTEHELLDIIIKVDVDGACVCACGYAYTVWVWMCVRVCVCVGKRACLCEKACGWVRVRLSLGGAAGYHHRGGRRRHVRVGGWVCVRVRMRAWRVCVWGVSVSVLGVGGWWLQHFICLLCVQGCRCVCVSVGVSFPCAVVLPGTS